MPWAILPAARRFSGLSMPWSAELRIMCVSGSGRVSAYADTAPSAAKSVAAQPSYTDGLEVFAIASDDAVYHTWCERMDWPWTRWTLLEREPQTRSPLA